VLESGLGANAFGWVPVRAKVAQLTQVCTYDRAGLGYSDEGPAPRSAERIADELARLLDSAGIEKPVIVAGASLGGLNARVLATKYPATVAGLILVDASHEDQQKRLVAAGFQPEDASDLEFIPFLSAIGVMRLRGQTLGRSLERADATVRPYIRATVHRTSRYRALRQEMMALDASLEEMRGLRRVLDLPVLVLTAGKWPEATRAIHTDLQRDLATTSRQSCQRVVVGAGHDIVGDAPGVVVQAISAMVEAVRTGSASRVCEAFPAG
jgi:pimeloyl-ACP methyl ester carboxylesterase